MPEAIKSVHVIFTLISIGILVGLGWSLIQMAVAWPFNRIGGGAAIICALIVLVAWLI